jgi:serine/threonine-protein kinase
MDLLARWEELRRQGREVTIDALCADCPELAGRLAERVAFLRGMSALDVGSTDSFPSPPGDAPATTAPGAWPDALHATAVYEPRRRHAMGGQGEVLVARHQELDRLVALKRVRPDRLHEHARRRFLREAAITARLQHPGIVPVYATGQDRDGPFYTMPLVEGQTLQEAIAAFHGDEALRRDPGRRSLAFRSLLQRFIAVCETIAYAHDQGVTHRDLKPSNIILGAYGETLVMDWGLAKSLRGDDPPEDDGDGPSPSPSPDALTATGAVLGTPRYMSPEQAKGEPTGPASDVFSLGLVLYEVLTGRAAFDPAGFQGADPLRAVREAAIAPPLAHDPRLPRALGSVCLKALAAEPAGRYATARELGGDIERWLADEPVSAYREPMVARGRRWMRQHQTAVAAAAVGVLVALVGLAAVAAVRAAVRGESNRQLALKNHDLDQTARRLAQANDELTSANKAVRLERDRAEARLDLAIGAIDSFRGAVTASLDVQDRPDLTGLRDDLLRKPLEFYRRLREDELKAGGTSAGARARLARANNLLGNVTYEVGSMSDAARSYAEAIEILDRVITEEPDVRGHRVELAMALNNLGIIQAQKEQQEAALATHGRARELRERMLLQTPEDADLASDLAVTRNNIGNVLHAAGRLREAIEEYEASRKLGERLVGEHPEVIRYRNHLALTLGNLGGVQNHVGDTRGALTSLNRAVELREATERDEPSVGHRANLASALYEVGRIHVEIGPVSEALRHLRRSREIYEAVGEERPGVVRYRHDLGNVLNLTGLSLHRASRLEEAAASLERAVDVLGKLTREHPDVPGYRSILGDALGNLANVFSDAGRHTEAIELHERLEESDQALIRDFPDSVSFRVKLASTRANHAISLLDAGRTDESLARHEDARVLMQRLCDDNPESAVYRAKLATFQNNFAYALSRARKLAESLLAYDQSLATWEGVVRDFPGVSQYEEQLAWVSGGRGMVLEQLGRRAEALEGHERARGLHAGLVARHPEELRYRSLLVWSDTQIGLHQRQTGRLVEALDSHRLALVMMDDLVRASPQSAEYRNYLANCRANLVQTLNSVASALESRRGRTDDPSWHYRVAASLAQCVPFLGPGSPIKGPGPDVLAAQAMRALHLAADEGAVEYGPLKADPAFGPIRSLPDFQLLLLDVAMPADPFND